MTTQSNVRNNVFISYSHGDGVWLDRVQQFLSQLEQDYKAEIWDDRKIAPGANWFNEIKSAISGARVAVLLVNSKFMASDFIEKDELPPLLDAAANDGATVIPVIIGHSRFPRTPLASYQCLNDPSKPLNGLPEAEQDSYLQKLTDQIEDILKSAPPPPPSPPTTDDVFREQTTPMPIENRWTRVRDIRRPILDVTVPAYVLDMNFHFLDWNPTFDEIVAGPLGLVRGDHAMEFVRQLANSQEVIDRSKEVFGQGDPIVDTEILLYDNVKYGRINFQKFAAQIADEEGEPLAWALTLNVLSAEKIDDLWRDMANCLRQHVNWSRYAVSYDKLLQPFKDYDDLVDLVVGMVGDAKCVADLGAGTGNGAVKLLTTDPEREVWAVESNEDMLEYMRAKIQNLDSADGSLQDRVTIVKGDILRLGEMEELFDAAILINVLYAVDDPKRYLQEVYRVLKPGGVVVFSTPHRDTDETALLDKLRVELVRNRTFASLSQNYAVAKAVHEQMDDRIHRDSKDDIRRYVLEAGFQIDEWRDNEYVDAVVVVKAVK